MSLNTHKKIKVLLAGGGTGGHIYPGVALAKELMTRENIECLMVITSKATDKQIVKSECIPYKSLPIRGMNWKFSVKTIVDLYRFALSFIRAWRIITSYTPDMIIGLGAYVSFPIISIGRIKGVTTFIHEQNLLPGKANLLLGKWVDGIFTSFPQTERFFSQNKLKMLGNPLRIIPSGIDKKRMRIKLGLKPDFFTFLVFGGSRGSHSINVKAAEAFKIIKSLDFPFQVLHQTGKEDFDYVAGFYKTEGIISLTRPFFNQMIDLYLLSDLVISRSGAGTISELTATGKPAILIPYPDATADHQRLNAMELVRAGGARMILESHLTGRLLASETMELIRNPDSLKKMAQVNLELGRPNAAKAICDQALLWHQKRHRREYAS
jgi:UDP-N-acetylglucosamine--N-acetylmuramyl-(pentapeptide) pyrophosphoryl-undecaprenol N-acetylglucosamine transferase